MSNAITVPPPSPAYIAETAARNDVTQMLVLYRRIKLRRASGIPANPQVGTPAVTAEQYNTALGAGEGGAERLALIEKLAGDIEAATAQPAQA